MAETERADSDRVLVQRQARAALRGLFRPRTYIGAAREAALGVLHLTTYPFGVAPNGDPAERATRGAGSPKASGAADRRSPAALPVVLVHGWIHNRSAFLGMSRAFKRAGVDYVHGFNYNPLLHDIPEIATMLAAEVERVLTATGAPRCTVVGHSLGGLVARYYVQRMGGEDTVDTVVTMGTPHRGTYTAYLSPDPCAVQMRPRSSLLRELEETARPSSVRWLAYYSDLDVSVLPAVNAKLVHPALGATNVKIGDTGHLSLLLSGELLHSVLAHLADPELDRPARASQPASLPSTSQRLRRGDSGESAGLQPAGGATRPSRGTTTGEAVSDGSVSDGTAPYGATSDSAALSGGRRRR
jgi:pimeloyl-ACP methyl ester carboxylesterase